MVENKKNIFLEKAKNKFGDKFDFSQVSYKNIKTKIEIICPEHGSFFVSPEVFLNSKYGCSKCSNKAQSKKQLSNQKDFIKKAQIIHENKFDYSKVKYKKSTDKVEIICKKHGSFFQTPASHLLGKGCKKCSTEIIKSKLINKNFINEANLKFNNKFNYSFVDYKNCDLKVKIICPIHGEFYMTPYNHLSSKYGCHQCYREYSAKTKIENNKKIIFNRFKKIHSDKYFYEENYYIGFHNKIKAICSIHGEFEQLPSNHLAGNGCPKCANQISNLEDFVEEFLKSNKIKFLKNDRKVLNGQELDFYIPSKNIAIECNGVYWHSELAGKEKKYHLNKTEKCLQKGIQLIHIFENEIKLKPQIVTSRLKSILSINKKPIMARKCIIKEIDTKTKNDFLNKYHIQGKCSSKINLGLFYNNKIVAVMTFGSKRIITNQKNSDNEYELLRYCGNFNFYVIGGASKLLNYFEKQYKPKSIISYCDRRWSNGDLYNKLGFVLVGKCSPNYWYFLTKDLILYHRYNFVKNKLNKKIKNFNPNKTEWENMKKNGWNRIWDSGNLKFQKNFI